jgi:hypothetical protein
MSATEGWLWQLFLDPPVRGVVLSILALPYGLLAVAGMGAQLAGWLPVKTGSDLATGRLAVISAGAVATVLGALVVREARRLAAIDITTLYDVHRQAAQVGGMGVFLVFLAVNAAVIVACVRIVQRALRPMR